MDLHKNWNEVKSLFHETLKSSSHYAIASTGSDGEPHVTPIGSLILGEPGHGFYFEKYTKNLPSNIKSNNKVCVLAVNGSQWFWLKSLVIGRFVSPPAVRLHGKAKDLRPANQQEIELWQKRVRQVKFTKGYKLMWSEMNMVREIEFERIEPIYIGQMTRGLWNGNQI